MNDLDASETLEVVLCLADSLMVTRVFGPVIAEIRAEMFDVELGLGQRQLLFPLNDN